MTDETNISAPTLRPVQGGRMRFVSARTIFALIIREMSTTYGRSVGGYIWAVLEPALGIAVLTAIFSLGFRDPPLGSNFAIFYATGLLPFFLFNLVINNLTMAILYSRALLAYPRVTFIDAILARFILATVTQLLVHLLVISGILFFSETRTVLEIDRMLLAYAMCISLSFAIGVFNCFVGTLFPVWRSAWNIMTRPMILISGIIFIYENVPAPFNDWLLWNPLMHVTAEMRAAFYFSYDAQYVNPAYVFGVSGVLALTGLVFLRRYNRDLQEL